MAKKVVASLQKRGSKDLSKVIRAMRSPKTGAYIFKEEMFPTDSVAKVLAEKVTD